MMSIPPPSIPRKPRRVVGTPYVSSFAAIGDGSDKEGYIGYIMRNLGVGYDQAFDYLNNHVPFYGEVPGSFEASTIRLASNLLLPKELSYAGQNLASFLWQRYKAGTFDRTAYPALGTMRFIANYPFDPMVRNQDGSYSALSMARMSGDPVPSAQEVIDLAASRGYNVPDLPPRSFERGYMPSVLPPVSEVPVQRSALESAMEEARRRVSEPWRMPVAPASPLQQEGGSGSRYRIPGILHSAVEMVAGEGAGDAAQGIINAISGEGRNILQS